MSAESLEKVKAHMLRILEPLREQYSAAMLAAAVDHLLLHDSGEGPRQAVPLGELTDEMRTCVCMSATLLQAAINLRNGTENPVVLVRTKR